MDTGNRSGWLPVLLMLGTVSVAAGGDTPVLPVDDLSRHLFEAASPFGLPELERRLADPRARARFDLGRLLFFDPILSVDRTVACASVILCPLEASNGARDEGATAGGSTKTIVATALAAPPGSSTTT